MPAIRPLPPRPSLEYARKEAKALLRRLRAGDPEALARARSRHPRIDGTDPTATRLADAQLVLAREHGFASWPRLVRYIGDVERQQHAHMQIHWGADQCEAQARRLIERHGARSAHAGRTLAAYVPRFYGLPMEEVFASSVTEDEARLAVARGYGAPSWEVLLERLEADARSRPEDRQRDPFRRAFEAMEDADLLALERIVAEHPELLHPSEYDISAGRTLMGTALGRERKLGADAMRPIMGWLAAHGLDRQLELNRRLCGHGIGFPVAERVREVLDQGADPSWVAPNGIPVLEHALLRYWNGEAVDVIAARTTPRKALWIAAGLGDVEGVRSFLDQNGRPTPAAHRHRPDFVAAGRGGGIPQLPEADDEEILLEALLVAVLNGRGEVIEYMASRGAPVNSLRFGMPLVTLAIGNHRMGAAAEALVRAGADLDLRGSSQGHTAREAARMLFEQSPEDPERRRMLVLCGMDPDEVLAERNARPAPTPEPSPGLKKAIALASDDAARQGRREVGPENLFIGMMRAWESPVYLLHEMKIDVRRFRAALAERLAPSDEGAERLELPMDAEAHAGMDDAIALATERRRGELHDFHLLTALTRQPDGPVGRLLASLGVDPAAFHERAAAQAAKG